jgi:hypothetical protein
MMTPIHPSDGPGILNFGPEMLAITGMLKNIKIYYEDIKYFVFMLNAIR